ncbi:uncharacterized protein LOC126324069 [Schistocerca gregaria]|uniref:uncharacterized protein LOC126324069 n=1 Tax=Schistocerca gregaria TaxID=7010 RepID=UPI00211E3756|nr:uncharacterized protein LOC126324069 [Schistocerca gregaria]
MSTERAVYLRVLDSLRISDKRVQKTAVSLMRSVKYKIHASMGPDGFKQPSKSNLLEQAYCICAHFSCNRFRLSFDLQLAIHLFGFTNRTYCTTFDLVCNLLDIPRQSISYLCDELGCPSVKDAALSLYLRYRQRSCYNLDLFVLYRNHDHSILAAVVCAHEKLSLELPPSLLLHVDSSRSGSWDSVYSDMKRVAKLHPRHCPSRPSHKTPTPSSSPRVALTALTKPQNDDAHPLSPPLPSPSPNSRAPSPEPHQAISPTSRKDRAAEESRILAWKQAVLSSCNH